MNFCRLKRSTKERISRNAADARKNYSETAKEKKSSVVILVKAEDVTNAVKNLNKHMEDSIMDYNLASVNESPIVDIFHYEG